MSPFFVLRFLFSSERPFQNDSMSRLKERDGGWSQFATTPYKSIGYNLEVTNCDLKLGRMSLFYLWVPPKTFGSSFRRKPESSISFLVPGFRRDDVWTPAFAGVTFLELPINQQGIALRSQIVTLKKGKNIKYLPLAFTEQGVAMLSSVLRSERAVLVNIEIMRAFVHLRAMLISHKDLAQKLAQLEKRYDHQFKMVFDAIRQLMAPPSAPAKRKIGFETGSKN